jgi:hypothetical protein
MNPSHPQVEEQFPEPRRGFRVPEITVRGYNPGIKESRFAREIKDEQ